MNPENKLAKTIPMRSANTQSVIAVPHAALELTL
jgi:hypothetical protein